MSNDGYEGNDENKVLKEPQVKYWAHDPRNLHVDVEVTVHKECYDKIKKDYPDFDQPVQDYATCTYKTLDDKGVIVLKTPTTFKTEQDKLYADAKAEAEAKIEADKIK